MCGRCRWRTSAGRLAAILGVLHKRSAPRRGRLAAVRSMSPGGTASRDSWKVSTPSIRRERHEERRPRQFITSSRGAVAALDETLEGSAAVGA